MGGKLRKQIPFTVVALTCANKLQATYGEPQATGLACLLACLLSVRHWNVVVVVVSSTLLGDDNNQAHNKYQ
ncbi:hypothetical protein T4E_9463 [Trichinella pseudospiralis]|uniref:Uncharacterized protein n=1 Tax=Trichinella pseudospiralis TaxID=6337 RepID=A0A0V0XT32_TRIPS|nr:hypothetical protein T4E_9463 [Trichinella pseudospiralis]